jgi:hypothetical protein
VKTAFTEFRRTHHDEWSQHQLAFTEEQLEQLNGMLISPHYYV